ncbi:MAG: RNA polymerase sigma factor [Chloroflexales bacterium]|nr:RNA polymerase sigma factor [Chloroflexales bacterium]
MSIDERDAIATLKMGDIQGLEVLVQLHYVHAVRTVYLITHDRDLAEDIVQTAFIRTYERIDQFDVNRPFSPWFLRSVVNDAVKITTRQARQISLEQESHDKALARFEQLIDPQLGPDLLAEQAETREAVWTALLALSPHQRAVVVQRYYLGMTESEMATSADCPPGTIKSRLNAARNKLQGLLAALQTQPARSRSRK